MRNDLSEIVLVVDRSGSMDSCRTDAEGGINNFIEEQKKVAGEANLTLGHFDTDYEFVHNGVRIGEVGHYTLVPRGWTALLDAVGRAIVEVGSRLEKMDEKDRPGCVVFVIVTDGHENSSKEFTRDQVRQKITEQRDKYNWQFIFLGADESAFDEGKAMGISMAAVAQYDTQKSSKAYVATSRGVSKMRCCVADGQAASFAYSDEDRKNIV
jgi:Mg-chelatase subunit ChlD